MNTVSVVLAIHNEEKNIERCLDAVKYFADEIVLVDGESNDNTLELIKKYHPKLIQTTNKLNFHINKQMAMDAASGDYVLQLDADEVVDADLANFITKLKKNDSKNTDVAWWIPRKNYFLGAFLKKGGQYPDAVIRLYKRGFARLPQKDVHEQMEVDGSLATADGHLVHYSNPTFADYIRKFNTYTTFAAKELHNKKKSPGVLLALIYCVFKPVSTFFWLFVRHKGFYDGIPGFVFAVMSGLHHPIVFLKLWEFSHE